MIIISRKFTKDLKRHNFDLINKGRVLDAICELLDEPDLGRGIRKKGANYFFDAIGKKWQLNFDLSDGNIHLLNLWHHDKGIDNKKSSKKRKKYSPKKLNVTNAVVGFSEEDFEILNLAFESQNETEIKNYFEKIREQIFPKFDDLGSRVHSRLEKDLGVRLFPHKAEMANILNYPVVWLAFTGSEDDHYENHSQLTFHLGIDDCIHEPTTYQYHFCIKLAVFHDRIDNKIFHTNLKNHSDLITKYIRKLGRPYSMRFYRKREKPPEDLLPVFHRSSDDYLKFLKLLRPDSIAKGFYGFSFSRNYIYHESPNRENFSDIAWVEDEMVTEFSKLMNLYIMFSQNDPLGKIEDYQKWKKQFNDRKSSTKR
jgi:uncharacterized protein YktB (UPF0637 family)